MARKTFRPKKRFGQNFLYDPAIAGKILAAADLETGQPVIELGAGRGILTRPLVDRGVRLIALEIDRDLHRELKAAVSGPSVEILNVDFTTISIAELLASRGLKSCVLVGNIPYNLTREVLFSFLVDEVEMLDAAYLMMQKEVGDRIASPAGSRVYGITSVILQSLYDVRTLFKVSPGSFTPRPRVGSVVLGFEPLDHPLVEPVDIPRFLRLVKSVFQQRRKTLHNTIKAFYGLSEERLEWIGRTSGIDLGKRPEALSKEQFHGLWRALEEALG